jgi:hypothetical protein
MPGGWFSGLHGNEITIEPFDDHASDGFRGNDSFGDPVTYSCRIEYVQRRMMSMEGREITSRGSIIISGDPDVSYRDRMTIGEHSPSQPPILRVEKQRGIYGEVLSTMVYF